MGSPSEIQRRGTDERAPVSAAQSPSRRNDESWVEIASQPSSSSLSSIGDEIVTTGLRVGGQAQAHPQRRRRLLQQHLAAHPPSHIPRSPAQGFTSSQEEYDETESEEDRLMASSAEHIQRPTTPGLPAQPTAIGPAVFSSDEDDDDDRATALGKPSSSPTFRPQPNAFSHPPSHLQRRSHSSTSAPPHHPPFARPPIGHRSQTRVQRNGPNFMSPSYREDNDAALRASLTTLLSCAAAARGLPKKDDAVAGPSRAEAGLRPSTQPTDLRLVSEATLMAETGAAPSAAQARTDSNSSAPSRPASASSRGDAIKTKRAASSASPASKPVRAIKKKKTAVDADGSNAAFLSPTVLTWVVSAGVVVLVSVVSFGAGYVIGREVGAQEASVLGAASSGTGNATSCGREIVRSTSGGTLRRFRWGAGMTRSVAA